MVEEVKVTRNYRVTIPVSARTKLGVKVGDVLISDFQDSKIVFQKKSSDISSIQIRLGNMKKTKVDWRDVEETIREAGDKLGTSRSH